MMHTEKTHSNFLAKDFKIFPSVSCGMLCNPHLSHTFLDREAPETPPYNSSDSEMYAV
jgi:hypothetical protein